MPLLASHLLKRAKEASRERRYDDAAAFYEEVARLRPKAKRLLIQCGHMRKEAGDLARAEAHYLAAYEHLGNDADLALQLGHFYKVKGDLGRAEQFYRRATEIQPGWDVPERELQHLYAKGWNGETRPLSPVESAAPPARAAVSRRKPTL